MGKIASYISKLKRKTEAIILNVLSKKNKKIIVITGCGRSGTTYSSKVLSELGIAIGHERLKKDGISSWFLASKRKQVPLGPSLDDLKKYDKLIIHQVRHPLSTISSLLALGKPSWKFLSEEIPINYAEDSKILRAMKYYYYWNLQAEKIAMVRIKAEEFNDVIIPILKDFKMQINEKKNITLNETTKVNTRKHEILTWADLYQEDEELTYNIKRLSKKYGYEVWFYGI